MSKTVLVTGSAKGIGKACVIAFAKMGYNVIINYLTSGTEALKLKEFIERDLGGSALAIKADVSDEKQVIKMFNEIHDKYKNIDALINNAAYCHDNYYTDKTKEEFLRVLEINVVGTFLVTKHAVKYMNDGVILNISSTDAVDTYNELSIDYCASKAAVNSLTKTFSLALPNIKFISVMLPWVKTESVLDMNPMYLESELKRTGQKRLLEVCEVSEYIIDIMNEKDVISGSVLRMDGEFDV